MYLTILHTESSTGWGGQEHRTYKEMLGLSRLGHRVLLVCQVGAELGVRLRAQGFEVHEIAMRNSADIFSVWRMARLFRAEKVDVVNTHSGRDSILAGVAGRLSGKLVVRTRHLAMPITSRFTYSTVPHHVVCVSEFVRQYLISEKIPEAQTSTVYTGIDPAALQAPENPSLRKELGLLPTDKIILTVAILRRKKGHRFIVSAAKEILSKHPNAHFVFAGDGAQLKNLEVQIKAENVSKNFHLLGLRKDMANLLASADLFVLPTEQEALGTSYIEAMSFGLPIIGSNTGGVPEVVSHGNNGFLTDAGDIPALTNAINALLGDEKLCQKMGGESRQRVSTLFHVDTMCAGMEALYRRLLKKF